MDKHPVGRIVPSGSALIAGMFFGFTQTDPSHPVLPQLLVCLFVLGMGMGGR